MILAMTAPPAHVQTLKLEDLRRNVSLTAPQISPDGKSVAVLVRRSDFKKDRNVYDLVLIDVATTSARTLLHDAAGISNVEWSPDGSRIAYIARAGSGDDAENQLFVLPMNGGEPVQLTKQAHGVDGLDWRPDGGAIAFSGSTAAPNEAAIKAHADEFNVIDEAWTAQEAPTQNRLYEIPVQGGAARRIGKGDWSVGGGFTYAKDGRSVFVTRISDHQHENRYLAREIVRVDVATGKATSVAKVSKTQADPLRARDGFIAFSATNPRGTMQTEMALANAAGMGTRIVTYKLDRNVTSAAFEPDGGLLLAANDGTQRRLFRVTRAGAVSHISLGTLSVSSDPSVARTGRVAFVAVTPDRPSELYVYDTSTNKAIRLTNYNSWIARYRLGKTRAVTWRTFDGLTADGVLTAPPGWNGGRAPLVLYIHGGPTSASTIAYSGFVQVLAAHGWFVFQPNYRGSDNLGLRYARTTVPHIASVPGRDIEDGLAQVLRTVPVDRSRIGVSGWSEGGLMTSWLISHDRRWRAAVSGAAVNDWVQYGAMTDAKDFTPQFISPSPWQSSSQYAMYEAESPLTFAQNVRTPTLIMSDSGDYRVPTPLAYEFYHEVRATGTPVQFVVYPVVGHFPTDPVRAEDVTRRWEAWFVRYLRY